jgi:hypothetical protein
MSVSLREREREREREFEELREISTRKCMLRRVGLREFYR